MNSRLDLMIIPAFLAASSVGLYSVATNISWVVVSISAAIAAIVLPAAARHAEDGVPVVVRALQATFLVASDAGGGDCARRRASRSGSSTGTTSRAASCPLRLLLPGSVCYACAAVLWSGLYALNRPLTAAASQGLGLVVTVIGPHPLPQSGRDRGGGARLHRRLRRRVRDSARPLPACGSTSPGVSSSRLRRSRASGTLVPFSGSRP